MTKSTKYSQKRWSLASLYPAPNTPEMKAAYKELETLAAAFEKSSLVEINPLEEKFDPHKHQAISQIEADGEPNRVINVLQKGYALHDRVIRPALVVVSKAKA